MFFNRRTGPSQGIAVIQVNDGLLLNRGFEFDLSGDIIRNKDAFLNLSVNGYTLNNELLSSPIDPATGEEKAITVNGLYGISKGKSVFDYYTRQYRGVDPDTGLSMWTSYYDDVNSNGTFDAGTDVVIQDLVDYQSGAEQNGEVVNLAETTTTEVNDATLHYTGQNAIPDIQGATRLSFGYKGLSLTGQLLYVMGGHGYDGNYAALMDDDLFGTNNWHEDIENRWQEPGDITDVPALTGGLGGESSNQNAASTRFMTKLDHIVLNNVRLNYQLPQSIFSNWKIQGVNVWVSGDNLWAQTARSGYFPFATESGSTNREAYDPLSTITTGLKFTF